MVEKRLELRVDSDKIVLNLWRIDGNKTLIKLSGEDGELAMTINPHTDAEEFLRKSLLFIKELGI